MSTDSMFAGDDYYGVISNDKVMRGKIQAVGLQRMVVAANIVVTVSAFFIIISGVFPLSFPFLLGSLLSAVVSQIFYTSDVDLAVERVGYKTQVGYFYGWLVSFYLGGMTAVIMNGRIWTGIFWAVFALGGVWLQASQLKRVAEKLN